MYTFDLSTDILCHHITGTLLRGYNLNNTSMLNPTMSWGSYNMPSKLLTKNITFLHPRTDHTLMTIIVTKYYCPV